MTLFPPHLLFTPFFWTISTDYDFKFQLPSQLWLQKKLPASLQRGKPPTNECPDDNTKKSDGKVLVMRELWGMQTTSLLPSLPGPLRSGVVAPDRALPIYESYRTKM